MKINVPQIDETQLALFVQQAGSGAAFSGNVINYVTYSGFLGNTVVYTTGGAQDITGIKRFLDSPLVPYYSSTGSAPSARWVNDQISTATTSLLAVDSATSGYALAISGQLSAVRVTGSSVISNVNLTGYGGTLVFRSGAFVFISGGAGGGGGAGNSNVSVTGSSTITSPNFTGVGSVVLTYDGTYVRVSGTAGADATLSGYVESNFVNRSTDQIVTGTKTFVASPLVPLPTAPSGAANLLFVSGVSGVLTSLAGSVTNNYYITGAGVVAASSTGVVTNTFNVTSGNIAVSSSGTVNNTFNGTVVNNPINIASVTGNFVNMGVFFDEFSLATGLNLWEGFVGRSFVFTGYGLGAINTGTQGFLSGSFYQRTPTNTKTNFVDFYLNSGTFFYASGGFSQEVSGMNRVGLDIYRIGTGFTGVSVGLFGVGY